MVDEARGPRHSTRFRHFLAERNRARFRRVFADWLADQAPRADAGDAARATPAEILDARERARAREERVLAEPMASLPDRLVLAPDLEAEAARLRREVEDAFMAELIASEDALASEASRLHRSYAEVRTELDRVHRDHAELHADLDRVHRAHAEVHAELDRVHRAYAELWEDRERLRDVASPPLAKDDHA
jgi:chromosome segregation ATPase